MTPTAEFLRTYGLLKAIAFALNSPHPCSWERKTKGELRRLLYAALTSLINIYFSPPQPELSLCVSAGTTTRTRFSAARNRQPGEWEPMYQTLVSVGSLSFGTFASVTKFGSCKGVWESTEKARTASPQFLLIQYHNSLARGVGHARTGNLPLNYYRCCAEEERGLTRQEGPLGPMS